MKTYVHNTKQITLAAVASLCLSAAAVGAHADQTINDVQTRTVHYSDLDLGTQAGATALYDRIRNAAKQVCGDASSRQLVEAAAARACINRAIASSVHSVNSARLASVYDSHFGVSEKTNGVTALR
jgi:UrcA family protein